MTPSSNEKHSTPGFPVYCVEWADDETVILGGGGGPSKSGISNKLVLAKISRDEGTVGYINELTLSNEEEAPMTLALDREIQVLVTGMNATIAHLQAGKNEHCRVFSYADEQITFVKGEQTIDHVWDGDKAYPYQKYTSLSLDAEYLAICTTDDSSLSKRVFTVLRFPSLESIAALDIQGEVVDLDWGGDDGRWLCIATTSALLLYQLALTGGSCNLVLQHTIHPPTDLADIRFRAARFSPASSSHQAIHAFLNTVKPGKGRKAAWVCTFGLLAGWTIVRKRKLSGKPVTTFDVSADGKLLAVGCADLSIAMIDALTLKPLLRIPEAPGLTLTSLKFNPSANLLIDNTLRIIVVPASYRNGLPISPALIAFMVLLLALLLAATRS